MAQSIASYEASAEVTNFTSKFDAVLAGKAKFTAEEQAGYDLFRGKAQCNACHRDGQQYRHACQSEASLLPGKSARCPGLRR
jgi:cytochrome c peroxidase